MEYPTLPCCINAGSSSFPVSSVLCPQCSLLSTEGPQYFSIECPQLPSVLIIKSMLWTASKTHSLYLTTAIANWVGCMEEWNRMLLAGLGQQSAVP